MKKIAVLTVFICIAVVSCTTKGGSGADAEKTTTGTGGVNLNTAIGEFTEYIAGRLPGGTLTAVAVTDTPVQRLGNYVADELSVALLDNGGLRMVSRQDFERVVAE
jgi:hypothetical protein